MPDATPWRREVCLPLSLSSFVEGQQMHAEEFFELWCRQNFVLNESMQQQQSPNMHAFMHACMHACGVRGVHAAATKPQCACVYACMHACGVRGAHAAAAKPLYVCMQVVYMSQRLKPAAPNGELQLCLPFFFRVLGIIFLFICFFF